MEFQQPPVLVYIETNDEGHVTKYFLVSLSSRQKNQ